MDKNPLGLKSRDEQMREKGYVFCPKHPTKWFDPTKFTECYACHMARQEGKAH